MQGAGPFRRTELRRAGLSDRQLARAVASGDLIRLRPGAYCRPDLDAGIQAAVSMGARLACVSELRRRGAWVLASPLHVHFSPHRGRVESGDAVRHLDRLTCPPAPGSVSLVDALLQAFRCLPDSQAVAALDSVRNKHLIAPAELEACGSASHRVARIVARSDPRAESGLETFARLIALRAGLRVRPQVTFRGIGRVDLVIQDAVVVEADGDAFHTDAAARRRDRRRDAALAGIGYPVLRFGFDQLVGQPDLVARAMIEAIRVHRGVKRSGRIADRALIRARNLGPP